MGIKVIRCISVIWLLLMYGVVVAQPADQEQDAKVDFTSKRAGAFEGSIKFIQETISDTNYYTYYVKGNMVRLDVHSNCSNCEEENRLLFNIKEGSINALHPKRKLYMTLSAHPFVPVEDKNFKVIRTKNYKYIHDYKCYQWRVKNKEQNTEVTYWVVDDKFDFFDDFLRLWNRSEKHSKYFLQIPETNGFFPMLSVERTSLRDQKMRLEVLEVNKSELPEEMFLIPDDFQIYDQ